jgi:hypothetical protein
MSAAKIVPALLALTAVLAAPASASADGLPVPIDTSNAGVSAPQGGPRYFAIPVDRGALVLRMSPDGTTVERQRFLRSRSRRVSPLAVPGVALDGSVSGLSADGRTLVLIEPRQRFPRSATRLAVLDALRLEVIDRIELEGDFSFDAISPDGSTIYLIHYIDRRDPTRYEVRAYALAERALRADPIVESKTADVAMRGLPRSRVTSPDGRWEYTLYDGNGKTPFVHALNVAEGETVCVEVGGFLKRGWNGSLAIDPAGTTVTVSGKVGPVAALDTESFELTDRRVSPSAGVADDDGSGFPARLVLAAVGILLVLGAGIAARRRSARSQRHGRRAARPPLTSLQRVHADRGR